LAWGVCIGVATCLACCCPVMGGGRLAGSVLDKCTFPLGLVSSCPKRIHVGGPLRGREREECGCAVTGCGGATPALPGCQARGFSFWFVTQKTQVSGASPQPTVQLASCLCAEHAWSRNEVREDISSGQKQAPDMEAHSAGQLRELLLLLLAASGQCSHVDGTSSPMCTPSTTTVGWQP
jgi:hypothetical protein